MNILKSLFIAIYPVILMLISGYAGYQIFTKGYDAIWLAAILTTLPMLLFFSRVMLLRDMPRTTKRFPLLSLIAFAGLILAVYTHVNLPAEAKQASFHAYYSAMVGYLCFVIYNYWYSSFSRDQNQHLEIGSKLTSFPLTDVDGNSVNSSIFSGAPAILLFFRGNWCPLCMAQIKEIAEKYRELAELGAKVALISPQPESHTSKLASKFDVPMQFFTDKENQAAKILGIEMKHGLPTGMQVLGYDSDTVLPTVIIIDEKGIILYADATDNYRVRPEPQAFIEVLQNR